MLSIGVMVCLIGCCGGGGERQQAKLFKDDLAVLRAHSDVIVLSDKAGRSQVAVVPAYQGRVMTSTAGGPDGLSFGWVNQKLIKSGEIRKKINPYGGEERFWLGPEGGQFGIFFGKEAPNFDFQYWQTPAIIDTEPFEVVSSSASHADFTKKTKLANRTGTGFDIKIDRSVRLMDKADVETALGINVPEGVEFVAYKSDNKITNLGPGWSKQTGLLSIWILGMFNHSAGTTIVIPYVAGDEKERGRIVKDDYFGKVPGDRLVVKDNVVFFKGDGRMRSKIGIGPKRVKNICGSYDSISKIVTLIKFSLPDGAATADYVNSAWEMQKSPYSGDVVNSYNDGPNPSGEILGPFYEIESSSCGLELKTSESVSHNSQTFHFTGSEAALDAITKSSLGVGLEQIKSAF
jgi:hypothetical protein